MQSDPNFDVRIAAAQSLGALGPAARAALPNIDGMLRQPAYEPPINATAEQLEAQMKDGDYRRALRDAKAKIARLAGCGKTTVDGHGIDFRLAEAESRWL
jgi:hypothetical protein